MDTYMYTRVQVSINVYVSVYVKRARRLQMEEEYMKGSEEEEEGSQDEVRGGWLDIGKDVYRRCPPPSKSTYTQYPHGYRDTRTDNTHMHTQTTT